MKGEIHDVTPSIIIIRKGGVRQFILHIRQSNFSAPHIRLILLLNFDAEKSASGLRDAKTRFYACRVRDSRRTINRLDIYKVDNTQTFTFVPFEAFL
jgi:hypothetical protein